jgi:hypothetical protein
MLSAQHQWDGELAKLKQQLAAAEASAAKAQAEVVAAQIMAARAEAKNKDLELQLSKLRKQSLEQMQKMQLVQQQNMALRELLNKLSVEHVEKDVLLDMRVEQNINSRM